MGLYYNPNPPFIGSQQPLEEATFTPSSGPLPQNPPFRGSRLGQETLNCWAAAVVVASLTPILAPLLVPQPVAAAATPIFKKHNFEIYRAWDAPAPAPVMAVNLDPPVSGPAAQNPPLIGMRIPAPVLVAWVPPPPFPIVAVNMDPPIAGPAVNNPPVIGSRVPLPVSIAWLPPPPAPIVAINTDPPIAGPTPQNPPFAGGARVPGEVLTTWLPPVPAPIVGPLLLQVAPLTPFVPPGARVSSEVLVSWLPPAPAPIVAINVTPPSGAVASNPPFVGGARVSSEVLTGWAPVAVAPIVGPLFVSGAAAAPVPDTSTILQRGPAGRHFSRKRYEDEILAAREARREALERAEEIKVKTAKRALQTAASEAQKAITAAAETQAGEQEKLRQLADLLESAARAKQTGEVVAQANLAIAAAKAMAQAIQDEEDEAVALLLMT